MNKIYKDLMDLPAISGQEERVRKYMKDFMIKFSNFEIKQDRLGSLFAYKKSKVENAKTVMVAGHMDEVGMMVVKITKEGFLKVKAIGGLTGETFVSQVMNVYTDSGIIPGVFGSLPPHFRTKQALTIEDLMLDIGAETKEQALEMGVSLGDMVLFDNPYRQTKNENRVISKAIDNRFGCGLVLETIEHFNEIELPFNLVLGATVQEEVGLRGATTSGNMFLPDVFIALDSSPVNELDSNGIGALSKGFLVRMQDPRNMMDYRLMDYFINLAKDNKIPHQHFISKGGTDAAAVLDLGSGVLSTTIGLPSRYIHSTAAMFDKRDIDAARKMLFTILIDLNNEKIEDLQLNKLV